jgi:undecaprenyl pyrophosphate phosphatase UppP
MRTRRRVRSIHINPREWETVTATAITHKRRTRAIIVVVSIAAFAIGLLIDKLPSSQTHDDYWLVFVAPSMIAFIVGAIALTMLVWSYVTDRAAPPS